VIIVHLLFEASYNSCRTINEPLLSTITKLRAEQAKLLGKASHAHHILDIRMARSPLVALEFLDTLSSGLEPLVAKELAALVALKKADCAELKVPFDGKINQWYLQPYHPHSTIHPFLHRHRYHIVSYIGISVII
jgi:Zn-dependent oligopeptidase